MIEDYNKHYIRLKDGVVVLGFSDAFMQPQKDDICINEKGSRHFELNGQINPPLINDDGILIYKYAKNKIASRTKSEIEADRRILLEMEPTELEKLEKRVAALEKALDRRGESPEEERFKFNG